MYKWILIPLFIIVNALIWFFVIITASKQNLLPDFLRKLTPEQSPKTFQTDSSQVGGYNPSNMDLIIITILAIAVIGTPVLFFFQKNSNKK